MYAIDSVRHTRSAVLNLSNIRAILSDVEGEFDLIGEQVETLSRVNIGWGRLQEYAKTVLEIRESDDGKVSTRALNQVDAIMSLSRRGAGNHGKTLWDAYNGVTDWVDHERGTDESRAYNAVAGSGAEIKRRALEVALEYAR